MICASITEETVEDMVDVAKGCDCDLIELRLDCLATFDNLEKLSGIEKPVISACIPSWEGGKYLGDEEDRVKILKQACEFSQYITFELKASPKVRDEMISYAREKGVKTIIAYHNFEGTPKRAGMNTLIESGKAIGADIVKVAFTPNDNTDVLNTLSLISEFKETTPLIVISMGELGKPSRILAPLLGSFLTYGHPDQREPSGPGQYSITDLKKILGGL
ncbi:MAG: type I 3-dehydroquinate dehydratase [Methanobacteriota archaeon]